MLIFWKTEKNCICTRVGARLLNVWFPASNLYLVFLTSNANLFGSGKILVIIMMNLSQLNLGVRYWSKNLIDHRDSEGTWISSFPTQKDTGNLHIPLHVYLSILFHGSPVNSVYLVADPHDNYQQSWSVSASKYSETPLGYQTKIIYEQED